MKSKSDIAKELEAEQAQAALARYKAKNPGFATAPPSAAPPAREVPHATASVQAGQRSAVCPMCQSTEFKSVRQNNYGAQILGLLLILFVLVPALGLGGCVMAGSGMTRSEGGFGAGIVIVLAAIGIPIYLMNKTNRLRKCRHCGYSYPVA